MPYQLSRINKKHGPSSNNPGHTVRKASHRELLRCLVNMCQSSFILSCRASTQSPPGRWRSSKRRAAADCGETNPASRPWASSVKRRWSICDVCGRAFNAKHRCSLRHRSYTALLRFPESSQFHSQRLGALLDRIDNPPRSMFCIIGMGLGGK